MSFNEKYIKLILSTLFYLDGLYIIHSETEVEEGYIDLLLVRDKRYKQYIRYEWLIEIKYLKEKERASLPKVRAKAIEQLQNYSFSSQIAQRFQRDSLKRAALIFIGKNEIDCQLVE